MKKRLIIIVWSIVFFISPKVFAAKIHVCEASNDLCTHSQLEQLDKRAYQLEETVKEPCLTEAAIKSILEEMPFKIEDNLDIVVLSQDFVDINGLHVRKGESHYIFLNASAEKSTLIHELGHYLDRGLSKEEQYLNTLQKTRTKKGQWNNSIRESFAEDFRSYIEYRSGEYILGLIRLTKRGNYNFNKDTVAYFDSLFPEYVLEENIHSYTLGRFMPDGWFMFK